MATVALRRHSVLAFLCLSPGGMDNSSVPRYACRTASDSAPRRSGMGDGMVPPNSALRRARLALGCGQAELADQINRAGRAAGVELRCDARLVAKWEAGTVTWPQPRYRRSLEKVLGTPCVLLGFVQPPPKNGAA